MKFLALLVQGIPRSVRLDANLASTAAPLAALELAAVWVENTDQHRQLVNDYATRAKIYPAQLWRQVRRWFPWLLMLKAGWFEYRWRQTGDQQFIRLADDTWRQLLIKQ